MKFRPLHDRVLIEVLDSEEKTSGGIIIPDTAKEKPQEGKVVAVGSGARTEDGKIQNATLQIPRRAGDGRPPYPPDFTHMRDIHISSSRLLRRYKHASTAD